MGEGGRVGVSRGDASIVGTLVGRLVGVAVGVDVAVAVGVHVGVGVGVGVIVGDGVVVGVFVGDGVNVAVILGAASATCLDNGPESNIGFGEHAVSATSSNTMIEPATPGNSLGVCNVDVRYGWKKFSVISDAE